jgi:hypothetical protein
MAKYEIQPTVVLQNESIIYSVLKSRTDLNQFWVLKQFFYRNKMEFSFSNSRWLTEAEIEVPKI